MPEHRLVHALTLSHAPMAVVVGLMVGYRPDGWTTLVAGAWLAGLALLLAAARIAGGRRAVRS